MNLVVLLKGKDGQRGVPDGSGPEGKGPTGKRQGGCPKREDFDNDEAYEKAHKEWVASNGADVEKSLIYSPIQMIEKGFSYVSKEKMDNGKSKYRYEKHLRKPGSDKHPAGTSKVEPGRMEVMKRSKRILEKMLKNTIPSPEASKTGQQKRVQGRKPVSPPVKPSEKKPSGMGSNASHNVGSVIYNKIMGGGLSTGTIKQPTKKAAPKPKK